MNPLPHLFGDDQQHTNFANWT